MTAEVQIITRMNGPLLVKGPVKLIDHEGNEYNLSGKDTFALCRCGQSANKPFCDGTHKNCGWLADQKAPTAPPTA